MIQYNTSQGAFTFKPVSAGGSGAGKINKATFKTEGLTPTLPKLVTEEQLAALGYVTGAELDNKGFITLNDIPETETPSTAFSLFGVWGVDFPFNMVSYTSLTSGTGGLAFATHRVIKPFDSYTEDPIATTEIFGTIQGLKLILPTDQLHYIDSIRSNPGPVAWVFPAGMRTNGVVNAGVLSSAQQVTSHFENIQECTGVMASVDVVFKEPLNPDGSFAAVMFQWGEFPAVSLQNPWTAEIPFRYFTTVLV